MASELDYERRWADITEAKPSLWARAFEVFPRLSTPSLSVVALLIAPRVWHVQEVWLLGVVAALIGAVGVASCFGRRHEEAQPGVGARAPHARDEPGHPQLA